MQQLVVLKRGQVSKKYGFMELLGFQQADDRHFSVTVGQSHFWQINVMYLDDVRPFAATLELVLGYRNLAGGQVPSGPQDLHALADRIARLGAPRTAYQAGQVRLVEAAGTKLSNVWIAAIPGRVLVYKSRSASYPIQAFPVGASLQQVAEMGEYEQYYAALNFFGNQSNGAMMYPHLEAAVDWVLLHTFDFQSMREWAQALKEDKERPPETPAKKTRPAPRRPSRPPPAAAVPPPGNRDGGRFSFAALPAPPAEAEPAVQGTSPADAEAPARSGGSSWTGSEWGSEWGSSDSYSNSYSNSYSGSEGWSDGESVSDGGWDADGGLLDVSLVEKREDAEPPPPPRHLYPKDHPQYRALVLMESVGVQADVPRSISVQTDPETALVQLPAEVHSRESVAVEVPVSEVAVEHRDTRFRVEPIAEAEEKGAGVGAAAAEGPAAAAGGAAPARRDSQWDERSTPNGRTYYYTTGRPGGRRSASRRWTCRSSTRPRRTRRRRKAGTGCGRNTTGRKGRSTGTTRRRGASRSTGRTTRSGTTRAGVP